MTAAQRFSIVFLGLAGGLGLVLAANLVVLEHAGEYARLDQTIDLQERTGGRYNGLAHSLADYKYARYRAVAPVVAAIGTSRAMQLRAEFFTASFYNLGGLVQGPYQAQAIGHRLLFAEPPRLLLFMLDFWTFCDSTGTRRRGLERYHDGMGAVNRLFLPTRLLVDGSLTPADFLDLLGRDRTRGGRRLGFSSVISNRGFALDGSLSGVAPDVAATGAALALRWPEVLELVRTGAGQMQNGCRLSVQALEVLEAFVAGMTEAGARTILMLPPLPRPILAAMRQSGRYGYVDRLRQELGERFPDRFHDFHDPDSIGAQDVEFYDGLHGGPRIYARMLSRAAARDPAGLAAMVAAEVLRAPETVAGPDSGSDSGHLAVGADSGG